VPELHLYDFDGTLFRSPDKPKKWPKGKDFFSLPVSMDEPCVPEKPGPGWWINSTVAQAKQSIADPDVWAIVCTGRGDNTFARYRVPELLAQKGLNFDEVFLAPHTGQPVPFKKGVIAKLLRQFPAIDAVHIWEDRGDHLRDYEVFVNKLGVRCVPHFVQEKALPPLCTSQEALSRLAARYLHRVARRPTPESRAWAQDIKAREKHVLGAGRGFKALVKKLQPYADRALAEFPDKDKASLQRRGKAFVKLVKGLPEVANYLDKWIGTPEQNPKAASWRSQVIYQARNVLIYPHKFPLRDAVVAVGKQAFKGYEAIAIAESQSALREVVPEDIRAFLPKNIVVDVDPANVISRVTDRFVNEHETLEKKISRMRWLVGHYNEVVRQVRTDLKSGNELTRIAALVTAIIMETGIRPGQEGNKVVRVEDGTEIGVETFGAVTLGPAHVKFIRDGFAKLEFVGKMGSPNVAELSDRELVQLLQAYVGQAKKGGSKFVFVTKKGVPFAYSDLQRYFKERFSELSPTAFRKLKATATVLANLHEEQEGLYARIKEFARTQTGGLKERVTAEIVKTLDAAYTRAQQALSHEDVATTIRAYVNPEVVLRFLSQGSVEGKLEEAVLTGETRLSFDPEVFVARALKTAGSRVGATLQGLLSELEEEMENRDVFR